MEQHGASRGRRLTNDGEARGKALSAANVASLIEESLSVVEAAQFLGISPSRVRHRIRDGALYSMKTGGSLRLPAWQFSEDGVVPGLRDVLAALQTGTHPLSVSGFFTSPRPELLADGEPLTPLQWLRAGGPVPAVAELAVDFGRSL